MQREVMVSTVSTNSSVPLKRFTGRGSASNPLRPLHDSFTVQRETEIQECNRLVHSKATPGWSETAKPLTQGSAEGFWQLQTSVPGTSPTSRTRGPNPRHAPHSFLVSNLNRPSLI